MKTVSIYLLRHPQTKAVRYVGRTAYLNSRFKAHSTSKNGTPVSEWIAELASEGLSPELELIEECPAEQGDKRERFWISEYRAKGDMLNVHPLLKPAEKPDSRNVKFYLSMGIKRQLEKLAAKSNMTLPEYIQAVLQDAIRDKSRFTTIKA